MKQYRDRMIDLVRTGNLAGVEDLFKEIEAEFSDGETSKQITKLKRKILQLEGANDTKKNQLIDFAGMLKSVADSKTPYTDALGPTVTPLKPFDDTK